MKQQVHHPANRQSKNDLLFLKPRTYSRRRQLILLSVLSCICILFAVSGKAQISNQRFPNYPTLPSGWTGSGLFNGTARGCPSGASPCFNGNGDYLVSPAINNPDELSFTTARSSNTAAWSLDVQISAVGSASGWTTVFTAGTPGSGCTNVGPIDLSGYPGSRYIRFLDSRSSGAHERNIDNVTVTVAAPTPSITLSSTNPAVTAGNVSQGTVGHIIYKFQTAVTTANATLNTASFTSTGTYTTADVSNFRLWYSTTNNFSTATQVGSTVTTGLGTGSHTFSSVSRTTNSGQTGYFWITTDVTSSAVIGRTISVSAITTTGLVYASGTESGTASAGGAQTITAPPGATTITPGATTAPATISSLLNTQGAATSNFDFTITDDGTLPGTDALDTRISQIVIEQGSSNTIADWSQAIAGAVLTDGTNTIAGTVNATNITFAGITNNSGDLGFVADDAGKNYSVMIWLRTALGGTLPVTIDNKNFVFRVQTSGVTTLSANSSLMALSQNEQSDITGNKVAVAATKLVYVQQPANTGINDAMIPAVSVAATDANNNRDLDYTAPVTITSDGTLSGSATTTIAAASGLASFNNLVHSALGTGLMLTAQDGALPSVVSNPFDIRLLSSASDYFRSVISGNWNNVATWESSADGNTWMQATLTPDANANNITIRNGDTVTISAAAIFDQTSVQAGGVLVLSSSYTINNGAGEDLSIENGGIFLLNTEAAPGGAGTTRIRTGGSLVVASISSGANLTANYLSAANARIFYEDSAIADIRITSTNPTSTGITFFNTGATDMPVLRISSLGFPTNFGGAGGTTINGRLEANINITLAATAAKTIRGGITGTGTVSSAGPVTFTSANTIFGGSVTLSLGNFTLQNGATIPAGANVKITSGTITKTAGNFVVDGTLDMGTASMTNSTDGVTINGTLTTANPNGLSDAANSTFATGAGTLTLNPGSAINYAGTQVISARTDYQNLTISGGGVKTLAGPVTVNNIMTLTNGVLALAGNDLTAAGNITGASAASYIRTNGAGMLRQNLTTGSTVSFPVGNSTFNPVVLTGNAATNSIFAVRVIDDIMENGTSGSTVTLSPTIQRTWDVSGTGNVDMTLQWNGGEENGNAPTFDYNHAYIAHFNAAENKWEHYIGSAASAGQANGSGPYTVTQAGISSFSPFTVASSGTTPLAVNLAAITATNNGSVNNVAWTTAHETGGDVFVVERSGDRSAFTEIGRIPATGKASDYRFPDAKPLEGRSYYRLKMIAGNGAVTYSKTVSAYISGKDAFSVSVFPNPAAAQVHVTVNGQSAGHAALTVMDQSGKVVLNGTPDNGAADLDLARLPAGTYWIRYSDERHNTAVQVVKK